jgi:hypothetical protein
MPERDQTMLRRLLDRLLATRARRDREVRFSDSWQAADDELHAIEHAIFRGPLDPPREEANGSMRPFRDRQNTRDVQNTRAARAPRRPITPRNAPAS